MRMTVATIQKSEHQTIKISAQISVYSTQSHDQYLHMYTCIYEMGNLFE